MLVSAAAPIAAVAASAARALRQGWIPTGDDAYIAMRATDVFSAHPPLVGTWSSASVWAHRNVNHPGPALFYALALPVRLLGPTVGSAAGMVVVNAASIAAVAWLARRRAGDGLAVAAMVAVSGLLLAMGHSLLFDPWNPYAALLPFLVFLFAVWGALCGDGFALLFVAVAGAFALQTHLSYVLLVPGLTALAVAGYGWRWWRDRVARSGRWAAAAGAVGLLCWLPPLWQEVTGHPGNLSQLWAASHAPQHGALGGRTAIEIASAVLARPPWWLPPGWAQPSFGRAGHGAGPLSLTVVSLAALGAGLALVAVAAARRQDRAVVSAVAVAAVAAVLAVATTARSSAPFGHLADYLRWLWAISLFTLTAGGWGLARAVVSLSALDRRRATVGPVRRLSTAWASRRSPAHSALSNRPVSTASGMGWGRARAVLLVGGAAVAVAAAFAVPMRGALGDGSPGWSIEPARVLTRQVVPRLRSKGPFLLQPTAASASKAVTPPLQLALSRHGVRWITTQPAIAAQVGASRYQARTDDSRLLVVAGRTARRTPAGVTRLGYYGPPAASATSRHDPIAVLLLPKRTS